MTVKEVDAIQWIEPWERITDEIHAKRIEAELRREMNPRHRPFHDHFGAVALNGSDGVLFFVERIPPVLAVVHLTFSGHADPYDNFLDTVVFNSVEAIVSDCMIEELDEGKP
jgi:hypothetical protein